MGGGNAPGSDLLYGSGMTEITPASDIVERPTEAELILEKVAAADLAPADIVVARVPGLILAVVSGEFDAPHLR